MRCAEFFRGDLSYLIALCITQIIRKAVSGMLPKNKLRERRLQRLRIFDDGDMGVFEQNILKRWEDGTLVQSKLTQPPTKISSSSAA